MLSQRHFLVVHLPSSLHFQVSFYFHFLTIFFSQTEGLAAACCFIDANTASAFFGFPTVRAYTITVVDKISAVYATRQILFVHYHFASTTSTVA
jgi:hypothetical protein